MWKNKGCSKPPKLARKDLFEGTDLIRLTFVWVRTTTDASPAECVLEALDRSSRSIWAAQCPFLCGKSLGTPWKGLLDPHEPHAGGTASDTGTWEMLLRPPLSLWAWGQVGLVWMLRASTVELNGAKCDPVEGTGSNKSNLCFKKHLCVGEKVKR